jgi:hypothetical protein
MKQKSAEEITSRIIEVVKYASPNDSFSSLMSVAISIYFTYYPKPSSEDLLGIILEMFNDIEKEKNDT